MSEVILQGTGGPRPQVPGDGRVHAGPVPTPVTRLDRIFPLAQAQLWAKLEQLQVSGSAKERSAAFLLDGAECDGSLRPGGTVVESTSGNLGVALARQCALRGYRFVAVIDDRATTTTCRALRAFGAEIELVTVPEGGNRLVARVRRVADLVATTPGAVSVNQYESSANPAAHATTTLPELVASLGRAPTHLYVATSTVGTLLGCQQAIAEHGWETRLVAVDAFGSVLWGGDAGERKLPGLGAGFVTGHAARALPDAVHRVDESDMVRGCRLMARREGMLVGASTGAVVAAVGRDLPRMGADEVVAMLVHDGGAPYLETVFDDDWVWAETLDPERALASGCGAWPFPTAVQGGHR